MQKTTNFMVVLTNLGFIMIKIGGKAHKTRKNLVTTDY